jgi:hypothetical protein
MTCATSEGSTPESCSGMALELFPLSFWRNVTADTARASFGAIFFLVEITKGYNSHTNVLTAVTSGAQSKNGIPLRCQLPEVLVLAIALDRSRQTSLTTRLR